MSLSKIFFESAWLSKTSNSIEREMQTWKDNNRNYITQISRISGIAEKDIPCRFCGELNAIKDETFILIPIGKRKAYFCYVSKISDLPLLENSIVSRHDTFLNGETFYSSNFSWFKEKCDYFKVAINEENFNDLIKKIDSANYSNIKRLQRNQKIIGEFRNLVPKKCMICGSTSTFKDSKGNEYFEVHHVIPYDTITKEIFPNTNLDCMDNLSLLCPTCHKKIHLSDADTRRECINTLLKSNGRNLLFWNNLLGTKLDNKELDDIINEVYRKIFNFAE